MRGWRPSRRAWEWLVVGAPCLMLIGLWLPGVDQGFPRTDTEVYAAVGLHAVEDGVWWRPSAGEAPYFNKPPVVLWVHGLVLSWFGGASGVPAMWLIRLPTLVAGVGALALTVDAIRRIAGLRGALLTGLVLATTVEFFRYTKAISLDMWVCLWCCAAVWCVVRGVFGRTGLTWWLVMAGVPIGLCLLTKPVLALMPWAVIGGWLGVIGRGQRGRLLLGHAGGLGVALAVAAPWHVAMWLHYGDAFWGAYVGGQVLERVTSDAHGWAPVWYYPLEIARSYWPWMVTAVWAAWWGVSRRRVAVPGVLLVLIVSWVVVWLGAASAASDKASRYIVSVYPMLAALSGVFLALHGPRVLARALTTATVWGAAVVPAAGVVLLGLNVRVHGAASDHWVALLGVLREHPGVPVVVSEHSVSLEGTIYLDRRAWPGVVGAGGAPAGSIVVEVVKAERGRDEIVAGLPSGAEVVLDERPFVVWRAPAAR